MSCIYNGLGQKALCLYANEFNVHITNVTCKIFMLIVVNELRYFTVMSLELMKWRELLCSYTTHTLHLLHPFSGPSCGTGQPILDLICNETIYLPMVMSYNNVLISSLFKTNAQFGIYNLTFDVITLEATRGFTRLQEWREREINC